MKFVWNFMKNVCRKEKPLNAKRPNPFVDRNEPESSEAQGELIEVLQELPNEVLDQKVDGLLNSVLNINEHLPQDDEAIKLKIIPQETQDTESKTDAGSQDEHLDKTGTGSTMKEYRLTSDGQGNFTSEDSGDEELEGENPQKRRKLSNLDANKEENNITQEWDHDLKLIKRNLGRINHLFEVYDGYKTRRTPLKLSSDLIIQESVTKDQSGAKERRTDSTRASAIKSAVRFVEPLSSVEKTQKVVSCQIAEASMGGLIEDGNCGKESVSGDFIVDLTEQC